MEDISVKHFLINMKFRTWLEDDTEKCFSVVNRN